MLIENIGKDAQKTRLMSLSIVSRLVRFSTMRLSDPPVTLDRSSAKCRRLRSYPSARPTEEVVLFTGNSSFFGRGVVSVTRTVATVLSYCDWRKMSQWMTSQHSNTPAAPRPS